MFVQLAGGGWRGEEAWAEFKHGATRPKAQTNE